MITAPALKLFAMAFLQLASDDFDYVSLPCSNPEPKLPAIVDESTNCAALGEWRDKAECYFVLGHFYDQRGDEVRALDNYNMSIAVDPRVRHSEGRRPCQCRPECDARDGPIALYDHSFPAPQGLVDLETVRVASLTDAAERDPRYALGWVRLARLHLFFNWSGGPRLDDEAGPDENLALDRAIVALGKAIELDPDYEMAWFERGNAYLRAGNYKRAIVNFSKAIELDPSDWSFREARAFWYLERGEYDLAHADLNKMIEIAPNNPSSWLARSRLYQNMLQAEWARADDCMAASVDVNQVDGSRHILSDGYCPHEFVPSNSGALRRAR